MSNRDCAMEPIVDRALRHAARCRILLALHADGPLSPSEFAKTPLGRGGRVNVYSYHFKELANCGLVEAVLQGSGDQEDAHRYAATDALTQPVVDAAALLAISDVLEGIPETLHQWIEGTHMETVVSLVKKAGRNRERPSGRTTA